MGRQGSLSIWLTASLCWVDKLSQRNARGRQWKRIAGVLIGWRVGTTLSQPSFSSRRPTSVQSFSLRGLSTDCHLSFVKLTRPSSLSDPRRKCVIRRNPLVLLVRVSDHLGAGVLLLGAKEVWEVVVDMPPKFRGGMPTTTNWTC